MVFNNSYLGFRLDRSPSAKALLLVLGKGSALCIESPALGAGVVRVALVGSPLLRERLTAMLATGA